MTPRADRAAGPIAGLRVLVVDDEADIRLGLDRLVSALGAAVRQAASAEAALAALELEEADLVLTDLAMPGLSGEALLGEVKRRWPSTAVVLLTGYGTIPAAVSCLQAGASHFLTKPFDNDEIQALVARLGRQILAARPGRTGAGADGAGPVLIAEDPRMRRVIELAERVAPSPVPVLIEGESGTGKELVAREIHARSAVAGRPFLAVNAAALPDTLLESELFGHRRGAFTGADRDRPGLFVEARGGTVFLDEIASMSLAFQAKLLRVLQEKVVRPLGSSLDVPVEFRLVSATNRDLEELIRGGAFRDDLYYRLRVVTIRVPPLRERKGDVPALALHFLARAARTCLGPDARVPELSEEAIEALRAHAWPGNVRELENAVQRAVVVCRGSRILPHHLGLAEAAWVGADSDAASGALDYEARKRQVLERFQREFLQRALERSGGNVSHAAQACGLTRAAVQRIMRQLGIERSEFTGD